MRFIDYTDQHRILLVFLPPHSTHRLQPLDIDLFSSLTNAYSEQIDQFTAEYQGLVTIEKRHFWQFFYKAWKRAFNEANIRSAFETTSIYLFNPNRVLAIFKKPIPELALSPSTKIPGSIRSLRRTYSRLHD